MRRSLAAVVASALLLGPMAGQADTLALYEFNGSSPASSDTDPNSTAGNMGVGGLVSIAGGVGLPGSALVFTCGFDAGSSCGDAPFILAPAAGFELNLQSLSFRVNDVRPNGSTYGGSGCLQLSTNLDGYASVVGRGCWAIQAPGTTPTFTIDLSAAAFQHLNAQNLPGGSLGLRLSGLSWGGVPGNCECFNFPLIADNITLSGLATADTDSDGIADSADNCRLVANSIQLDADHDGYGNICDADLNESGRVTTADYTIMRNALNSADPVADLNGSGFVTTADYTILRNRLNTAPGPSGLACAGTIPCP